MTPKWLASYVRHQRTIELSFAVFFSALLLYAIADWQRWLPWERGFQPLRVVCLSAALLLQAVGSLLRRRSYVLFYVCLAASMGFLVATFLVAS